MRWGAGEQLLATQEQLTHAGEASRQQDEALLQLRQDLSDLGAGLEEAHADKATLNDTVQAMTDELQDQQVSCFGLATTRSCGSSACPWPDIPYNLTLGVWQAQRAAEAARLADQLQTVQQALDAANAGILQAQQDVVNEQVWHVCQPERAPTAAECCQHSMGRPCAPMQAVLLAVKDALQGAKDEKEVLEGQLQAKHEQLGGQQAEHAAAHQAFVQRTDQVPPADALQHQYSHLPLHHMIIMSYDAGVCAVKLCIPC